MQRLRIKFSRGEEIKFISHLDIMRLWERAFRRARLPLAYSEGFNPHPRMSLAAPLAVGMTSEAELMDIVTARPVSPHWFTETVGRQLPTGIGIMGTYQTGLNIPSLQSQMRSAEYRVGLEADGLTPDALKSAAADLMSKNSLPWRHQRDTGERSYDLRALIEDLRPAENLSLDMKLRCGSNGSGRPEQVVLALGIASHPRSIHRTRLILEAQPAM